MPTGTYPIDAANAAEPLDSRYVADMPAEIRAIKARVNIANGSIDDFSAALRADDGGKLVGFSHQMVVPSDTVAAKLRQVVSITDSPYDGSAGGVLDNAAAMTAAAAAVGNAGTVKFPFIPGTANVYYFAAWDSTTILNITLDVDPGVVLSTPGDTPLGYAVGRSNFYVRPTKFYFRSLNTYCTFTKEGHLLPSEKLTWLDDAALDRSVISPVLCNTAEIVPLDIAWNASDSWVAGTFSASTAKSFSLAPASDSTFHCGMRKVLPGDELCASFTVTGAPLILAVVRTTEGFQGLFTSVDNSAATLTYFKKETGVSGVSSDMTYPWQGIHASYAPINSVWSIQIEAWNRYSILCNGYVMLTVGTGSGYIHQAGFGMYPTAGGQVVNVNDVTVTRRKSPRGAQFISVKVFGDSKSAPRYDGIVDYLKDALEFTSGGRAWKLDNQAVGGEAVAQQWVRMQAVGVADVTDVVINVGTNDVQGGTPVATYLSTLTSMVTYVQTSGKACHLVDFGLWYTQGQAGARGQASSNYEKTAPYRSALRRLAADKNCKLVDLPSLLGPVLANYVNNALGLDLTAAGDPIVVDNIHPTAMYNRLAAKAIAAAIVGNKWGANGTMKLPNVPLAAVANGWAVSTQQPYANITSDGCVQLDGLINDPGGAIHTDGTTILILPAHLRPLRTLRIRVATQNVSEYGLLLISSTGEVQVFGITASNWIALDGISWVIDDRLGW